METTTWRGPDSPPWKRSRMAHRPDSETSRLGLNLLLSNHCHWHRLVCYDTVRSCVCATRVKVGSLTQVHTQVWNRCRSNVLRYVRHYAYRTQVVAQVANAGHAGCMTAQYSIHCVSTKPAPSCRVSTKIGSPTLASWLASRRSVDLL